jgi:hypothetical protein
MEQIQLWIDLDGVVIDFINYFINLVNDREGTKLSVKDIKGGWATLSQSGLVTKEIEDKHFNDFVAEGHFMNLPAIPGARKALFKLLTETRAWQPWYITARPKTSTSDTIVSLGQKGLRIFPQYDMPVRIVEHGIDKAKELDFFRHSGMKQILIEDRLETILQVKRMCPRVTTVLFNWNGQLGYSSADEKKADAYFTNWNDLYDWLKKIEKEEMKDADYSGEGLS